VLVPVPVLVPVLERIANFASSVTSSNGEEAILENLETIGNSSHCNDIDSSYITNNYVGSVIGTDKLHDTSGIYANHLACTSSLRGNLLALVRAWFCCQLGNSHNYSIRHFYPPGVDRSYFCKFIPKPLINMFGSSAVQSFRKPITPLVFSAPLHCRLFL
jgi:hypothetical protein